MEATKAIEAALRALEGPPEETPDVSRLDDIRRPLADGERVLFDRAMELRRDFGELHSRVLRSATFAEASLGTAAFIHELRQCLSPLMGLAELMKETPQSPFVGEWVNEIAAQAGRLADLLDRHAALLRTQTSEEAPCDLASVVGEAARYFNRLPPGVKLVVDLPANLPRAIARRRQLLHAIINLLANARDAHKGRPGTIRVTARTRPGELDLLIADQGSGVDPSIRARLFEPLFTTKREDGTGLGLFLSRELLRPRGDLALLDGRDVPEGFTTAFAIRLPLEPSPSAEVDGSKATTQLTESVKAAVKPVADDAWATARKRAYDRAAPLVSEERSNPVLLVEDEPAVRRMTRAVLESVAHLKIYEAADAAFALGLLEKLKVDFLVCDKNLPDQDGLEVIRRARQRHPWIDAMIVTGYPSPDSAAEAIRVGATDYLLKPVREVKTLRESVSSALLRQKLHRLCERHETVWREMTDDLARHAPKDSTLGAAVDAMRVQLAQELQPTRVAVAVIGEAEVQQALRSAGLEVVGLKHHGELSRLEEDVDLVVFPAEEPPEFARELVGTVRSLASPPHMVALGRFVHTETAVAALQGRTSVVIERSAALHDGKAPMLLAGARRRREARAEALGKLLRQLGFTL